MSKNYFSPSHLNCDAPAHSHEINPIKAVALFLLTLPEAVLKKFYLWQTRSRDRRAMRELSDHFLDDIGLTRSEVNKEVAKPFWKA